MPIWDKGTAADSMVMDFTAGRDRLLDTRIAVWDTVNSMAHAVMLHEAGLLSAKELKVILDALHIIYIDATAGRLVITPDSEDIHSHIESLLIQMTGDTGMKIHAGRSRNDQVLTDIYLYLRDEAALIAADVHRLLGFMVSLSDRYSNVMMPGYTHMQPAMPSSFGLWFGAWAESLCDDLQLIGYASSMLGANPSGTAAGYGTTLPLRREVTTELLGFDRLVINSLYAQVRRGKAEKLFADAIASVAFTLSRLAGDICLFMSKEFSFVTLRDEFTTGSSIMPQKKNPDVFEIIRGRANVLRAVPNTLSMLVTNLPTGYNRDYQVIKEVLFPAIEEVKSLIAMTSWMLPSVVINVKIADDPKYNPIYSAEAANRLVVKGVPFRDAYRMVAAQLHGGLFQKTTPADYTHTGSIGNTSTGLIATRAGKLMTMVSRVPHDQLVGRIMKI